MISQNIRSLREHEGFTQEALASRLGVARQTVAKWESGEATPDLENVRALARLFGVSIDDLANHDEVASGYPIPPRGKHIFGVVRVGERGRWLFPNAHARCSTLRLVANYSCSGTNRKGSPCRKSRMRSR